MLTTKLSNKECLYKIKLFTFKKMHLHVNNLIITFLIILVMDDFKMYPFANAMEVSNKLFTHIEANCNNNTSTKSKMNNNSYKLNEIYVGYNKHRKQLKKNSFTVYPNNNIDSNNILQMPMPRMYPTRLNVNNTVSNNNNTYKRNESKTDYYYNTNNVRHTTNEQTLRHHTSYDKSSDDILTGHKCNANKSNNNSNTTTRYSRNKKLTKPIYSPIILQEQDKSVNIGTSDIHDYRHEHDHDNDYNQRERQRRALKDLLIAPNTRWCGRGNIANNTYNHLGGALAADKCCRQHDHCPVFIPSLNKRFEIFNYRPYTLSHCSCDRRFRTCLKMANDDYAKAIGKIFFNVIQTQCIVLRKEHICQQRARSGDCLMENTKQRAYLKKNKKF